jgi:hypothetical protein
MRIERELTEVAQAERDDFRAEYGDGNCSCHLSPPCNSCIHPGNPVNQENDDDCYQPIDTGPDVMQAVRDFCKG